MTVLTISDNQVAELLLDLADHDHYVLLDTSLPGEDNQQSLLFTHPLEKLQLRIGEDRNRFFKKLDSKLQNGYYLAGWFAYEFLHDYHQIPCKEDGTTIADLGVYQPPRVLDAENLEPSVSSSPIDARYFGYQLENLVPSMHEENYCRAIKRILEYIAAGDTYQVNYTFKFTFDFNGSIPGLYRDLRRSQPVPYGCCIKDRDQYILSYSPELFFRADGRQIKARPMKGTLKRGRTVSEDLLNQKTLHNDEKNRSENVMIVDLLRNDLSRLIASTGGGYVNVSSLFDVERYRSVFQMTSSIVADRQSEEIVRPDAMLEALFPCGSVTGAPKIRTMQIIEELEEQPRGVYTGAIGYFSPDGQAVFNVPIRTIVVDGKKGEMGIGSGIVSDSSPQAEWQECLLKANFLTNPLPEFELIETMLYHPDDGYCCLKDHLNRMKHSASYFNIAFPEALIRDQLQELLPLLPADSYRKVRMTLSMESRITITHHHSDPPIATTLPQSVVPKEVSPVLIDFAGTTTDSSHPWLYHKTSNRVLYNDTYQVAKEEGLFDVIFCNERGEVTEGCITNIIIATGNRYYTPPLTCGLLGGIMRKQLLDVNQTDVKVIEKVLGKDDVINADAIFLCNAIRGVVRAELRNP